MSSGLVERCEYMYIVGACCSENLLTGSYVLIDQSLNRKESMLDILLGLQRWNNTLW